MVAKLQQLIQLAGVANRAAQARFNALRNEERALREQIASLLSDRQRASAEDRSVADTALAAGADLRWHRWIDSRIGQINTALARNRAAQIRARADLKTAFGREVALKALLARELKSQRTKQNRDADTRAL